MLSRAIAASTVSDEAVSICSGADEIGQLNESLLSRVISVILNFVQNLDSTNEAMYKWKISVLLLNTRSLKS